MTPADTTARPATETRATLPLGPVPHPGARAFLGLTRVDVGLAVGLVVLAFLLRLLSPIFPDAIPRPLSNHPTTPLSGLAFPVNATGCVDNVPVGPGGSPRRECGFVFDEVYFPVDAAKDLHRVDYFDPEPPLAKLLMTPPIALFGFTSWTWRLSTAIAGSLLVGLIYLIAMRLRRDRFFATAAALFICLDGLAFVESRTGVIDIIAIFFAALLYFAFLLHWQARTRTQWVVTLYLMAVVAGLAFGAKLTALAPLVVAASLIAARFLEPWLVRRSAVLQRIAAPGRGEAVMWRDAAGARPGLHYLAALLVAGAVFSACFSRYLTIDHNQVFHFDGCTVQGGLTVSSTEHDPIPVLHAGGVTLPDPARALRNIYADMQASLQYHQVECHTHPYSSDWYTWPAVLHPVLFYADYTSFKTASGAAETGWITDMGNPAVWWLAIPALLFCVWRATSGDLRWRLGVAGLGLAALTAMIVLYQHAEHGQTVKVHPGAGFNLAFIAMGLFCGLLTLSAVISRRFVPAFIVLGYLAAWLMWVDGNQHRVLFYYHMLGALIFAVLALAYALTALRRQRLQIGGRVVSLAPAAWAAVGVVVAAFIFFYPVWTGAPQTSADHNQRIWLTDCTATNQAHNDTPCWQ
ncbi:MAG: phospholipid carrier-dependent glycosyltransferase [Chloroflexi bacterium]|nr:MAG: phospholipid carrier-dependent glycosyltransferase [Chloroflexota bacterium]